MQTKNQYLPIEQKAKDETNQLKIYWNQGPYHFLLHRTMSFYNRSKTKQLREDVSDVIGKYLFPISDNVLLLTFPPKPDPV